MVKTRSVVADDDYVTRKQRRAYEDWREATDLTDEERAVGLPVIPSVDQGDALPPAPPRARPEIEGELPTLQARLAQVRDPDEAARALGRRRLASYALVATMVTAAFTAIAIYFIAEVAIGRVHAWSLAMLPGPLALAAFSGVIAYGGWYRVATGQQWPTSSKIDRFLGVLNNTYALPRRR